MLKNLKLVSFLLISLCVLACKTVKDKKTTSTDVYKSYGINHQATYFKIPPGMASVFLDDSKKGNAELKDLLNDVNQLSFLIFSKNNSIKKECQYYYELNSRLDSLNFFDLAQINSGKEIVRVKAEKNKKQFKELVVLISNYDALYCISFQGNIPPHKVVNLVKPENLVAITNLDRFKK